MKTIKYLLLSLFLIGGTAFKITDDTAKKTVYVADKKATEISWNGKKVTGEHYGNIELASGSLILDGKNLVGGEFVIDMSSITCLDLKDAGTNARLVNHLKSDDFFSVEKFPHAKFVVKNVKQNGNNHDITGDITIKGITKEISFPAEIEISDSQLNSKALITINRANFDVKFRSGSFFENLGDKMIYDDFTLDLNLVAKATANELSK